MARRGFTRYATKAKAEHVSGTRVKYTWPCGHYRTEDLNSERRPLARRVPTEEGVRILSRSWGDGVYVEACPTCAKKEE